MKKLLLLLVMGLSFSIASAQLIEKQVGLRLGVTSGISGKIIKNKSVALEGVLGFRNGGMQMYGLVESYKNLLEHMDQDLRLYFGGGAHVGWVADWYKKYWQSDPNVKYVDEYIAGPAFGIDGVFGVEYMFRGVPIVLGVEFKPYVELIGLYSVKVNFWDFGFKVAYRFN